MPSERDRHPEEEQLEGYAMGTLSGTEAAALEQHLLGCGECRRRLDDTVEYVTAMRQAAARFRLESRSGEPGNFLSRFGWRLRNALASLLRRPRRF